MPNEPSVVHEAKDVAVQSSMIRVEVLRLSGNQMLEWQRCPIADRVLVVTEGRGRCYRSHGKDELCDEVSQGDVVYLKRMLWHEIVPTTNETLVGVLVTSAPFDVEMRR